MFFLNVSRTLKNLSRRIVYRDILFEVEKIAQILYPYFGGFVTQNPCVFVLDVYVTREMSLVAELDTIKKISFLKSKAIFLDCICWFTVKLFEAAVAELFKINFRCCLVRQQAFVEDPTTCINNYTGLVYL